MAMKNKYGFEPTRPCNANDIILVSEGTQCSNCGAVSKDGNIKHDNPHN